MGKVTLRKRKYPNGTEALFVDIFYNGKRQRKNLGLFLIPECSKSDKAKNKETLRLANEIAKQYEIKVITNTYQVENKIYDNVLLCDYITKIDDIKHNSKTNLIKLFKQMEKFGIIYIRDFNTTNVNSFLEQKAKTITKRSLQTYIKSIKGIYNRLRREKIVSNELETISVRPEKTKREYLTLNEINDLKRNAQNNMYECAFFLSILTGLRFSDIISLEWQMIDFDNNRITKQIIKTDEWQTLDLSDNAITLLNSIQAKTKNKKGRIFSFGYYGCENYIKKWAKLSNINKHVTFHTARHTFAVLLLSNGVDIYTVSKLLGHQSIKTTEIYADIIDATRKNAIKKLPNIF